MLMTMRAYTEGCRAMALVAAAAYDAAHAPSGCRGAQAATRPSTSSWCRWSRATRTEMSLEVASLGVQVHGGMGFIEETGAAQYYRDARS